MLSEVEQSGGVVVAVTGSLYELLVFLHILGAMVWLGGLIILSVLASLALRSGGNEEVGRFVSSLPVVGPIALAPAMAAVVGFGIWLVLDSDAWSFRQTWIWLALALFACAFTIGAVFQSRAAIDAQRATESGDGGEAARQLRRWSWGMRLIVLLLIVAAWDMVFKPGL
jgi:uncharacterized membrane protein